MLLSAHEIVPSLFALEEIYSRPSSDMRVASQNAKIASVLRRKIVASLARLGNDQQVLHALRYSIHNTSIMYAFGLDIEDFQTPALYKRYRELTTEQELIRAFTRLRTSGTDTPFMDVIFEGTGIDDAQERETQLKALLKNTLENTYNIQYAVATVVKARISKGMDSSRARSIGGIDVGDFVINKVMDALVGREGDADDPLANLTKTRGPKTNTLFYKFFRRAEKRKSYLSVLEDDPTKAGQGKLSWRARKQAIISEMRNTSRILLDLVSKAIFEDKSSDSLGEEHQDAVMEAVTQSYADVLDTLSQESESKGDTDEARESLSDARRDYKADISNSEARQDYAQAIFDIIGSKQVSQTDLRFLLANPEALSSTPATQEAVRNVVYEQLFLRGALTSEELTYLDGGFDEKDLQRRARKEIKKIKMGVENEVGSLNLKSDIDDIFKGYDGALNVLVVLKNSIKQSGAVQQEGYRLLTSLNNAASLTAAKSLLREYYFDSISAEIFTFLDSEGNNLSSEDYQELEELREEITKNIEELEDITKRYIISPDLVGSKIVGKHPLSKFSIDAYPGTFSTSSDVVTAVGGLSAKKDFAKGLSALDLQVAKRVDDIVKNDPDLAEEVEAQKKQLRSLARLREATLILKAQKNPDADDLGKVDALLTRSMPSDLAEKVQELFDSVESGLEYNKRTNQAKALSAEVQKAINTLKAELKSSYSRMGVVSSLMREAVAEVVSDPRTRLGSDEYPHNVYSQRTKRNLLKNTGWSDLVESIRDELRGKGNATTTPLKEVERAVSKAGLDLFQEVLKDRGLDSKIEVARKKIKSSTLTNREFRSILTELGKRLLVTNPLIEKAKQISESALTKKVVELTKKINDANKSEEDDANKSEEGEVVLSDSAEANKRKEAFGSAFGSFISLARTGKVHKLSESRKALIDLGVDSNDLQALEDHIIMGNLYNFEDRIKDRIAKDIDTQVEKLEIERGRREAELRAKSELDEAETEELAQIESETDEKSTTIRRLMAQRKDRVSSEVSQARESRNVGNKIKYAPAVEDKEAKILESYNAVIGSAVDALLNVEDSMIMEGDNEKSVGGSLADNAILQRSKAIRTFSALKTKYPAENNTFSPVLRNSDDTTIEGLLEIYNSSPSSFPSLNASLNDSNEAKQLLFSFLSSPYHNNTLVRSTGEFYALSNNVFSELAYSEHIKSFVRNLVAACRGSVLLERKSDLADFYKNYYRSRSDLSVLANSYEIDGQESALNNSLMSVIGEIHVGLSLSELVKYLNNGSDDQAKAMIKNDAGATLQYGPYIYLLNSYKSLLDDLNVLLFLAADTVEESVIESYGIEPELVDKVRDLFGKDPVDIQKLIAEQG